MRLESRKTFNSGKFRNQLGTLKSFSITYTHSFPATHILYRLYKRNGSILRKIVPISLLKT
jgi:hypothetical protein